MTNARFSLAFFAALSVAALTVHVPAQATSLSVTGDHVHWSGHHDPSDARLAITTQDGKVTMLLTNHEIAMQLSDRMVHKVRHELSHKRKLEEQDNPVGGAIASAVIGTVSDLIDDSFSCCVREISDVSYVGGRLRLIDRYGKPVFDDADVCDTDVMASFAERDARRFVSEFRRLKAGD
ncbi:MAG: hypothetical protein E6K80_10660 [Candidatus Eisenbacteria bacterium]|uniref:Uncharacterized protein n=1 Tax=Eiseniibacteriota bacterium TaxID=2212470 RepID=A0A538U1I8_UNCEI|nr:MAG: hypothetical protein E6K80_10660 [Candidatus Eisenbacteria bacterium]